MKNIFIIFFVLVLSASVYIYFKADQIFIYSCTHHQYELSRVFFKLGYNEKSLKIYEASLWEVALRINDLKLMKMLVKYGIGNESDVVEFGCCTGGSSDGFFILHLAKQPDKYSEVLIDLFKSKLINKIYGKNKVYFNILKRDILLNVSEGNLKLIGLVLKNEKNIYIKDHDCENEHTFYHEECKTNSVFLMMPT